MPKKRLGPAGPSGGAREPSEKSRDPDGGGDRFGSECFCGCGGVWGLPGTRGVVEDYEERIKHLQKIIEDHDINIDEHEKVYSLDDLKQIYKEEQNK